MMADECATTTTPANADVAAAHRAYEHNQARFAEFYALQRTFAGHLACLPALVRAWLDSLPPREDGGEGPSASKSWRAARLSAARRRELSALIAKAEESGGALDGLAVFLLKSLPVETYFEIAEAARPSLRALNATAHEICNELAEKRNDLFAANYGLAKKAVRGRKNYHELLSAASCGLLAAIDRYVPEGEATARFAYFANFWIRYHISRYGQKNGTIVPLSINQQRIVRKIECYLRDCSCAGLPAPSELEICTALKISPEAYYWYLQRPVIVPLDSMSENEEGEPVRGAENWIASPALGPDEELEHTEIGIYARELLRKTVPPYQRVMLSYARRIGSLPDAAEDYLAELEVQALERLRGQAANVLRAT